MATLIAHRVATINTAIAPHCQILRSMGSLVVGIHTQPCVLGHAGVQLLYSQIRHMDQAGVLYLNCRLTLNLSSVQDES